MVQTYLSVLISKGVLVRSDMSENLDTTGFESYIVADDYVLQTTAQTDDATVSTVTYVQFFRGDENEEDYWVVQLEGFPEDPNNYGRSSSLQVDIFKRVGLYD